MTNSPCSKCGKYKQNKCEVPCKKLESLLEKEGLQPIEKTDRYRHVSLDALKDEENDEGKNKGNDLESSDSLYGNTDLKVKQRNILRPIPLDEFVVIMDKEKWEMVKEFTRFCDKKSRPLRKLERPRKHYFYEFMKCTSQKRIAERAGCKEQNINQYFLRIVKCVIKKIPERIRPRVNTPLRFKNAWKYNGPY